MRFLLPLVSLSLLALFGLASPPAHASVDDDAPTLGSVRKEARAAIEAGDWSLAKKKISQLKRIGKATVADECARLTDWRKARESLVKLQKAHDKGRLPKRAWLREVEKIRAKYGKVTEVHDETLILLRRLYDELFVLLDDFERERPLDPEVKRVRDPHRSGDYALQWTDATDFSSRCAFFCADPDWSTKEALIFWCHAKKPGQVFEVVAWEGDHGHIAQVRVTWTGWREVRLPLRGKKSPFRNDPGSDWKGMTSITFNKEEGMKIDVTIDDLMLEKQAIPKKRR